MKSHFSAQQVVGSLEDSHGLADNKQHIRPLAVRPLNHPEREPNPWGFLFSSTSVSRPLSAVGRPS